MAEDKEKDELDPEEKMMALIGVALGITNPEVEAFWRIKDIDVSSMSKEEKEFILQIRKDQWTSSIASILSALKSTGFLTEEREEGFKYSIKRGMQQGKGEEHGE